MEPMAYVEPMVTLEDMPALERQSSAIFARDRKGRPKYYRVDWEGVVLPREPSLRLSEGESFFEKISNEKETKKQKRNRFSDFVSRAGNVSTSKKLIALSEDDSKVPTKRRAPVPIKIRKLEIELTQRKLPRYPSQNHLSDPTFYPLASCDLFEWPPEEDCPENDEVCDLPERPDRKRVSFSDQIEEDNTTASTTDFGTDYLENEITEFEGEDELSTDDDESVEVIIEEDESSSEPSYEDESYYSSESSKSEDYVDDEVSMEADDIFQEFMELKQLQLQLQSVEKDEPEPIDETDHCIEETISFSMDESLSTIIDESVEDEFEEDDVPDDTCHAVDGSSRINKPKYPTIGFSTENLAETIYTGENDEYLREVGYVSPLVRMMIFQARMELRCKKVTEEHKEQLEPTLIEAIAMARATRLDEVIIETQGTNQVKHDDAVIPSVVWVKGNEHVSLPNFQDPTPPQFIIFKEAVALGGIKALKPEITTNYDPLASMKSCYDNELDVDDTTKHKLIRTKYLTEMYLHEYEWQHQSDDEDEESVHYDCLDDVQLPTDDCPTYSCSDAKLDEQELKEKISQQVAERVWERRYRLERPRAKQRIKYRCTCKYCKTASTYQTFAYRKKWLLQQNLWCKETVDNQIQATNDPLVDDSNEDTEIKKNSIRTTSTVKLTDGELSHIDESGSESDAAGLSDVSTIRSGSSFPQSKGFESREPDVVGTHYGKTPMKVKRPSSSPDAPIGLAGKELPEEKSPEVEKRKLTIGSSIRGLRSIFGN